MISKLITFFLEKHIKDFLEGKSEYDIPNIIYSSFTWSKRKILFMSFILPGLIFIGSKNLVVTVEPNNIYIKIIFISIYIILSIVFLFEFISVEVLHKEYIALSYDGITYQKFFSKKTILWCNVSNIENITKEDDEGFTHLSHIVIRSIDNHTMRLRCSNFSKVNFPKLVNTIRKKASLNT